MNKIKTLLLLTIFSVCFFNLFAQNSSLISDCDDFIAGPNATWPHILVATTIADGAVSQEAQTFTINITSLPSEGANVRVYKTTANGNDFFGDPVVLTLGSNNITVSAVSFDRAVKFQFSSGDVEFDALSLNGEDSECVCNTTTGTDTQVAIDSFTWIDGMTYTTSNNTATFTLMNSNYCDSIVTLNLTINNSSDIDAFDRQNGIKLFPNPTTNDITISLEGIDVVEVLLIDINGRVLLRQSGIFDQDRINLSSYVPGTYFVRIMTPEGRREIRVTKQ